MIILRLDVNINLERRIVVIFMKFCECKEKYLCIYELLSIFMLFYFSFVYEIFKGEDILLIL